jgi:hypothetical protein
LARFSDAAEAGKTMGIRPDDYSSGQIVSTAPIISGHNKLGKLINNPVPFGYYYRDGTETETTSPAMPGGPSGRGAFHGNRPSRPAKPHHNSKF